MKKNFLRFTAQDEVILEVNMTWTTHAQKIASEKCSVQAAQLKKPLSQKMLVSSTAGRRVEEGEERQSVHFSGKPAVLPP